MLKKYNNFINENRYSLLSDERYNKCLLSDITRMEIIDLFFKNVSENKDYNTETPSYSKLVDDWDGYDDQVYIENDLENNRFIFWEGWVKSCWGALYKKTEYKGLNKTESIEKIINDRFPRIGEEFGYVIEGYDYFKYKGYYIMSVSFIKKDKINERYLGSCVDVDNDESSMEIKDYFSDATELSYIIGNPDENDYGKTSEISKEKFFEYINIKNVPLNVFDGELRYFYVCGDTINDIKIEDASFFIIYNETEDIHYFFTKDLNKNNK